MPSSRARQSSPKRHQTFQTITLIDTRYSSSSVLPEADHIALGVVNVGAEAHRADRLLAERDLPAQLLDAGERLLDVVDPDRDDRRGDRALPAQHAAVDAAAVGRGGDHCVLQLGHRVELPPEGGAIELRGPFTVLE